VLAILHHGEESPPMIQTHLNQLLDGQFAEPAFNEAMARPQRSDVSRTLIAADQITCIGRSRSVG
jgi:hypothetical protein